MAEAVWSPQQIRDYYKSKGFDTFDQTDDNTIQQWINQGNWDQNAKHFTSERGSTGIDYNAQPDFKPQDCPAGQHPSGGDYSQCVPNGPGGGSGGGSGGAGGFGGWGGGGGSMGAGGIPTFNPTPFVAPKPEDVLSDPSYQFRLAQGTKALQGSAAAKGLLRTGGTLQDLVNYGQGAASQEYGNAYDRALQGWQANYGAQKDAFAPQFAGWQTQYGGDLAKWQSQYGGDLQKYLQKEQNIYGLLNPTMPSYGG